MIATIEALKEGENIQSCGVIVFYELSYLPTDNDQAVGRIRRRGQGRTTVDTYLICAERTIDDTTRRVVLKRGQTTDFDVLREFYREPDNA